MECSDTLSVIGLSLDIIGILGLFILGTPPGLIELTEDGQELLWPTGDSKEVGKFRKIIHKLSIKLSYTSLVLILIGFILQLIGTII